ncbi:hypothetical protein KSC_086680 [Ktedonobacter sp. SOSP1-52]|uniref:hypothetical protein n=1 Tax=Ktedonobacter sp. SOSP1-52 TaxID=2778366 RepID=UPI001914FDFF|nr:hypothetical protein [Ktedonobacter sp. SOSP1-52]GHO69776.1 hypothetical protein KSC_086680 [Ktedonobacter sp. SOSP1-52]
MGMFLEGTVKSANAFQVGQTGEKFLFTMNVVDELGNTFSCQMWDDDPQQPQLIQQPPARRQRVQMAVVGYSVRMRKSKDGKEVPQANFIVSDVRLAAAPDLAGAGGR